MSQEPDDDAAASPEQPKEPWEPWEPREPEDSDPQPVTDAVPSRPRRRPRQISQSIGGILFGFEQQVWRNMPPPHELVHHARPDDPVPAKDGGFVTFEMPDPSSPPTGRDNGPPPQAAPSIELVDLPPVRVVGVHVVQPMAVTDVGALVDRWYPELGGWIAAAGAAIAGPPYIRYADFGGETADLELGFPVSAEPSTGVARLADGALEVPGMGELPGGRAAVATHVGPYQALPGTWAALAAWVADHGLEPGGSPWESYVDNPDLVEPAALRTEVVQPIRG